MAIGSSDLELPVGEKRLFERLAEQAVPERARGKPRVQEPRRDTIELRVVDLDSLVAADDPVRDVWAYVATLDVTRLEAAIEAREGEPGRPAIPPKLLLALWLHATLRGVGSARELERLCEREVSFQWLCGGVGVNYHTLSDFRVANDALLDRLLSESVAVLIKEGLVTLDRLSLDGLRVRAAAGAASFRRGESLKKCLTKATALVAALRCEVADDPAAPERRRRAARERAAVERVARIKVAQERHKALQEERRRREETNANQTKEQKEPRASTTDPEARVMKMPDGGFRPGYNGELIAEPRSGVILGVAVDTSGSDRGWVKPMVEQVKERYGQAPKELLVDAGFSNAADIEWAAQPENGAVAVFMAPTKNKHGTDPYQPRDRDGPGVAAWRVRMASAAGQVIYRLRAIHECINAHLRQRRLYRMTVRGAAKVRMILLWHALAHNVARACALRRQRHAARATGA
jgi:transposase